MKNRNLGIQILRSLLCFWILLNHCLNKNNNKKLCTILFKYRMHVPCFILIAFYFSNKIIISRNIINIKKRLERLLIPYFILPIIILIINNILYNYTSFSLFGRILNIKDLFYQYLFGRKLIPVFWFFIIYYYIIPFWKKVFNYNYSYIFHILYYSIFKFQL